MNATKVPQEIELVKGPLPKKSETDSTTRLYNNWIRWIEEHGYATEEQVENFMGLRQRHSSRSVRSYVTDDDTEFESKSCIRASWCSKHQPPRIMTDDDTEEEDDDDDEEEEYGSIERRERRLSKLSLSLQALGCVVGSSRGFARRGVDESSYDEGSEQDDEDDKLDIRQGNDSESTNKNSLRRVTFLPDFVDDDDEGTSKQSLRRVTFLPDLVDDNGEGVPKKRRPRVNYEYIAQKEAALRELELSHCMEEDNQVWDTLRQVDPYEIDTFSI